LWSKTQGLFALQRDISWKRLRLVTRPKYARHVLSASFHLGPKLYEARKTYFGVQRSALE
jgi:hypothetical protein